MSEQKKHVLLVQVADQSNILSILACGMDPAQRQ